MSETCMTHVDNIDTVVAIGDRKEVLCTNHGYILVENNYTRKALMFKKVL